MLVAIIKTKSLTLTLKVEQIAIVPRIMIMVYGFQQSHLDTPEYTGVRKITTYTCGQSINTYQVPIAIKITIVGGLYVAACQKQANTCNQQKEMFHRRVFRIPVLLSVN